MGSIFSLRDQQSGDGHGLGAVESGEEKAVTSLMVLFETVFTDHWR